MQQISKKNIQKKCKSNKNKSKKKGIIFKGGARESLNDIYPPTESPRRQPQWRNCLSGSCSTIVRIPGIYLYGTSLPIWNQQEMENIFRFYLFRKDINRVISLQACATPQGATLHHNTCLPNNNLENYTFYIQKSLSSTTNNDANVQFIDIFIEDMTPGTLLAWRDLTSYRFNTPRDKTIIHCLAGFGRTGSILLFYSMYYGSSISDTLLNRFFSNNNSQEMYDTIIRFMQASIMLDVDSENNPYNTNNYIGRFNRDHLIAETTKISHNTIFHANLLISRINYCIMFYAYQHNVATDTPIYLYQLLNVGDVVSRQTIFRPILVDYVPVNIFDTIFLNSVYITP